jgi:hypothetical protein
MKFPPVLTPVGLAQLDTGDFLRHSVEVVAWLEGATEQRPSIIGC